MLRFKHPNPKVRAALAWSLVIAAVLAVACLVFHIVGLLALSRVSAVLLFASAGPAALLLLHESDHQ